MITISHQTMQWLEEAVRREIEGSRITSQNGTVLYTPDGVGNYGALWTRDFYYMAALFDLFPPQNLRAAIQYLLEGQRADGIVPDRRQADGVSVYEAGGWNHPVALPPLDNSAFLVSLVYEYVIHTQDDAFLQTALTPLRWAMDANPRGSHGLVWNDPQSPHSPYGFTDTVGKTGELLFCSLLDWKASKELIALSRRFQREDMANLFDKRSKEIEEGISILIDSHSGLFLAASADCRQIDIWGNAFAYAIGFPLSPDRKKQIVELFVKRRDDIVERGQIRHLLKGEYWQRMLVPIKQGEYQNGGYWATPSGWVMQTLAQDEPEAAQSLLNDLIADFKERGIHEWINGERVQLPHYVASITNTLKAVHDLRAENLLNVSD
ncbi:MAG: hypothetical protein AB1656_06210 [Candidatus Omnitrophota bacterium]